MKVRQQHIPERRSWGTESEAEAVDCKTAGPATVTVYGRLSQFGLYARVPAGAARRHSVMTMPSAS